MLAGKRSWTPFLLSLKLLFPYALLGNPLLDKGNQRRLTTSRRNCVSKIIFCVHVFLLGGVHLPLFGVFAQIAGPIWRQAGKRSPLVIVSENLICFQLKCRAK